MVLKEHTRLYTTAPMKRQRQPRHRHWALHEREVRDNSVFVQCSPARSASSAPSRGLLYLTTTLTLVLKCVCVLLGHSGTCGQVGPLEVEGKAPAPCVPRPACVRYSNILSIDLQSRRDVLERTPFARLAAVAYLKLQGML